MKKFALIGIVALSAMMVGCSSTQCRDGGTCADKSACKGDCGGDCEGKCAGSCEGKACAHANSTFKCPNPECSASSPCCANCAAKFAEMCPDCKGHANACPDCKDGKMCAKCEAAHS